MGSFGSVERSRQMPSGGVQSRGQQPTVTAQMGTHRHQQPRWRRAVARPRCGLHALLLFSLIAASDEAGNSSSAGSGELKRLKAYRSMRRVLVGDEAREYVEISMEFNLPVYARVCSRRDAIFVAAVNKCLACPTNCVLSSLFAGAPVVPGLLHEKQDMIDCICGLSYEEIQLRSSGWPGDPGFDGVKRVPPETFPSPMEKSATLAAYGTAVWQTDSLMVDVTCPDKKWPELSRSGVNGLPLANSLWWTQRFETAYGLEDIDKLLANASQVYDDKLVTFLLPVKWMKNGIERQLGPTMEEMNGCKLEFPILTGAKGERVSEIPRIAQVPKITRQCTRRALKGVREQVEAVMEQVPGAARQTVRCQEALRTSYHPDHNWRPPMDLWGDAKKLTRGRVRRVGALLLRSDFYPDDTIQCVTLRKQLRLRAYNMMQRVKSYTATDAANGCWEILENAVVFNKTEVWKVTDHCPHSPIEASYWYHPCCSMQMRRVKCCAVRNISIEQHEPVEVNTKYLAGLVHVDPTGGGAYGKRIMMTAMAWRRRLSEDSGTAKCQKTLAINEQAHVDSWRTFEQCHTAVMGQYDRDLRMYVGLPCIVNEDCYTECIKPKLETLERYTRLTTKSKERRQLLGHCRVPTDSSHVFLMKCLIERGGEEVREFFGQEMGLDAKKRQEADIVAELAASPSRMTRICVGPYASQAKAYTKQECLKPQWCNWNHELRSREDCEKMQNNNMEFCTCEEGSCPQLSLLSGCKVAAYSILECHEARQLLREQVEFSCVAEAKTSEEMARCGVLIDWHNTLMRRCFYPRCFPLTKVLLGDEMCYDAFRQNFASCHDQCNIPSGPNPLMRRQTCYTELLPNETAKDCYMITGDAEVHYRPHDTLLGLEVPQRFKARYCSVKLWNQLKDIRPPRSRPTEEATLDNRQIANVLGAESIRKQSQRKQYEADVAWMKNPVAFADCDFGAIPMDSDAKMACRARRRGCCLSPRNVTTAFCEPCDGVNTTVCRPGDKVFARWNPNMRFYGATINKEIGNDLAQVDWDDGGKFYRDVPFPHIFTPFGIACASESEGCSAHFQCRDDQFCMSCEQCRIEYGGNPPPHLCAPCPTYRDGACRAIDTCETLQSSIDGKCPKPKGKKPCECKQEWTMRGEYPGAPGENSIGGCYFDVARGERWCEVEKTDDCEASVLTGTSKFIFWKYCVPESCAHCQCDCTRSCTAFDVLPINGRLPEKIGNRSGAGFQGAEDGSKQKASEAIYRLPMPWLRYAGSIAPNCSIGGHSRVRGQCEYCTVCCAELCHNLAIGLPVGSNETEVAQAERVFAKAGFANEIWDCTATNVSGCVDSPRGWVDSIGRSCSDYKEMELCTFGGLYGLNWPAIPPTTFTTYVANGLIATQACCQCGGGADCTNIPLEWEDENGYACADYKARKWCKRGGEGYGPGWNLEWGAFPLGLQGIDALAACCDCGGGRPMVPPAEESLHLVNDFATCRKVFPGRAVFDYPVWSNEHFHYCRILNGICQKKLEAKVYDPGRGRGVPDEPRLLGLCEQRDFVTGLYQVLDDTQRSILPGAGGRRLYNGSNASLYNGSNVSYYSDAPLYSSSNVSLYNGSNVSEAQMSRRLYRFFQRGKRILTKRAQIVQRNASLYTLDFQGNLALGLCFYRLPDPWGMFGGPSRKTMPPPILRPHDPSQYQTDIFSAPGLKVLGWPVQFWGAMPSVASSYEALASVVLGEKEDPTQISGTLRVLVAKNDIELLPMSEFIKRQEKWTRDYKSIECEIGIFTKYQVDRVFNPGIYETERACVVPECSIDSILVGSDETACVSTYGCKKSCTYCSSTALVTQPQGLCYTAVPEKVAQCQHLGGIVLDGDMFDEHYGVSRYMRICALPHRPLTYCTEIGETIKRCVNFDENHCETDMLAKFMQCAVDIRPCPNPEECYNEGRCSDVDVGLTWTTPETCVVTPLNDRSIENRCDETTGLCFFRMDPPFGMEVRKLHELLDLLEEEDSSSQKASKGHSSGTSASFNTGQTEIPWDNDQLRNAGRLNRSECTNLGKLLPPSSSAIYLERSRTAHMCGRYEACCVSLIGDRCTLFSGTILDTFDPTAGRKERMEECDLCNGEWMKVFSWKLGGNWVRGQMRKSGRKWMYRRMDSANTWTESCIPGTYPPQCSPSSVDTGAIREILENAHQARLGRQRQNSVQCMLEPLMVALETVAAAVEAPEKDPTLFHEFPVLPNPKFKLGSVVAVGGMTSRTRLGTAEIMWHEFSTKTEDLGIFNTMYSLTLEPFELGLGGGATQLSLPGRAELAQGRLQQHVLAPEVTTTALPPDRTIYKVGPSEGYPPWLINQMLQMEGGASLDAEEKEKSANLLRDAQERKRIRLEMEARAREDANAASGLPKSSKDLLLGIEATGSFADEPLDGIFDGPCRSVIATTSGEIAGQILGDCIGLESSYPLVNSVEICMPLKFTGAALESTQHAQLVGVKFDFAKRGAVPTNYSTDLPPPIPAELGEIPGEVANALWNWRSSPLWGRMKPGTFTYQPLNYRVYKRKKDTELCAKVFERGVTYCPIVRLNSTFYGRLPRRPYPEKEFPSPYSECPALDRLLSEVQETQVNLSRTDQKYVRLERTAADAELMHAEQLYKDFRSQQTDLKGLGCPAGRKVVYKEESYRCVDL